MAWLGVDWVTEADRVGRSATRLPGASLKVSIEAVMSGNWFTEKDRGRRSASRLPGTRSNLSSLGCPGAPEGGESDPILRGDSMEAGSMLPGSERGDKIEVTLRAREVAASVEDANVEDSLSGWTTTSRCKFTT
jgi:hypothetical protein